MGPAPPALTRNTRTALIDDVIDPGETPPDAYRDEMARTKRVEGPRKKYRVMPV